MGIISFFKKWHQEKQEEKIVHHQKEKAKLQAAAKAGGLEEYKGKFGINNAFSSLFQNYKDGYCHLKFENFNSNINELLYEISVDSELMKSLGDNLPIAGNSSLLDLISKNMNKISRENQDILFSVIPAQMWLETKKRPGSKEEISIIFGLSLSFPASFELLLRNNNELKNELFNGKSCWVKTPDDAFSTHVQLGLLVDKWVELDTSASLNKKEKKRKEELFNLINYFMSITKIPEDPKGIEGKTIPMVMKKLSQLPVSFLNTLVENKKNDLSLIMLIPGLLESFKDDKNTDDESKIALMKRIFEINHFTPEKINKEHVLCIDEDKVLSKKAYKIWVDSFTNENTHADEVAKIAAHNMLHGEMTFFDSFLKEHSHSDIDYRVYLSLLSSPLFVPNFLKHMDVHLEYFKDKEGCELNEPRFYSDNNASFMEECIINNAVFDIEKMKKLKEYGFDPFKKNSQNKTPYELANSETKSAISGVYLEELAKFEKEAILKVIDNCSSNVVLDTPRKRL